MSCIGEIDWPGGSGKTYRFKAFTVDTIFSDVEGNYIFTRKENNVYKAVYIGQGVLSERISYRIREGEVIKKGITYICAIAVKDEENRRQIESDLLLGNPEAYAPTGCNIKEGG